MPPNASGKSTGAERKEGKRRAELIAVLLTSRRLWNKVSLTVGEERCLPHSPYTDQIQLAQGKGGCDHESTISISIIVQSRSGLVVHTCIFLWHSYRSAIVATKGYRSEKVSGFYAPRLECKQGCSNAVSIYRQIRELITICTPVFAISQLLGFVKEPVEFP